MTILKTNSNTNLKSGVNNWWLMMISNAHGLWTMTNNISRVGEGLQITKKFVAKHYFIEKAKPVLLNFWLLSPQISITFFIRTMEGICTLQNHAKFCKITWEFAKWKCRNGADVENNQQHGGGSGLVWMFFSTSQQVDFSSSSIGLFLLIKWISPHHHLIFPPHEVDLSSSSNGFVLLINWISPRYKMDFPHYQLDFSSSYVGFLLILNWILPIIFFLLI